MIEGVGDAVVERGQALAINTGADDRHVGLGKTIREVLVKNIKSSGRGMVEAGKAVEFTDSVFDVDSQLLVTGTICVEFFHGGFESLQAAIEGRAVDDIDRRIQLGDVLCQFL